MFLTKKHLSRRTVLKGAGAVISLPLLDAGGDASGEKRDRIDRDMRRQFELLLARQRRSVWHVRNIKVRQDAQNPLMHLRGDLLLGQVLHRNRVH